MRPVSAPRVSNRAAGIDQLLRLLPGSRFGRHAGVLAGGSVVGHGLTLAAVPVLARLYTPEDFGVLAVYGAVLTVLGVAASLRYELAIPLAGDDHDADDLLVLSLVIVLAVSGLSALAVWWPGRALAQGIDAGAAAGYLWWLPAGIAGAGFSQALGYWATRRKAFGRLAQARVTQTVTQVVAQVGLGILKAGPAGLVLGDVLGRIGASADLAILVRRAARGVLTRVRVGSWGRLLGRYARFPLYTLWGSLVNVLGIQMAPVVLASCFGAEAAGYYGLASRLLGVPATLLGQAVGLVFYSRVAEQRDPESRRLLLERAALGLLLLSLGSFGFIGVVGRVALEPLLGAEWAGVGRYVQLLAACYAVQFAVSPLSTLVLVQERQLTAFWITLYETGLRLSAILAGAYLGSAHLAVGLFAGAGILISVAYLAWLFRLVGSDLRGFVRRRSGCWAGFVAALGISSLAVHWLEAPAGVSTTLVAFGAWMLWGYRQCMSS